MTYSAADLAAAREHAIQIEVAMAELVQAAQLVLAPGRPGRRDPVADRLARQVLRAAEIDQRKLLRAADALADPAGNGLYGFDWLTPARRCVVNLAVQYGVPVDSPKDLS